MAQITFNLRKVDAIKLNPKYVALRSIKTDNVHVKEFLSNFQSEFWIAHTIKIHQSVKVTKKTFIRDRVVVIVYKKSNFTFLHDILKLVHKYNFPENYIDKLTQEYKTCGCVMFAIEAESACNNYY